MTAPEFRAWWEFYQLFPFDDVHRHHRPAALVAHSMSGADLDDLMGWLERPLKEPPKTGRYSAADLATIKALGMKPPKGTT